MNVLFELGEERYELRLPDDVTVLTMRGADRIPDPRTEIRRCLEDPIGTPGFSRIVRERLRETPRATAVIVISDTTRPVPYRGEQGILLPLVESLMQEGVPADRITVLCANGTHTPLPDAIFREMIDPEIFARGVRVVNHDCLDEKNLTFLGYTSKGTEIKINRLYVEADIKILTGLVESHFMAGVSGGRKSICPGLVGEDSTFIFHSARFLDDSHAEDLNLVDNPCHEEAIEVANSVGADFIVNVTLNQRFEVTGCFAGDMQLAHLAAFEKVKESVSIDESRTFDIVVTHAGFVGKNHYQAAKAATAALPLLRADSYLIMAGNCTDVDPVGKKTYRQVLPYLKGEDAETFVSMIKSPEWTFVPDQWQVQMWAKLFRVIPQDQFIYYAPQIVKEDYAILPGVDGNGFLPEEHRYERGSSDAIVSFLESALKGIRDRLEREGRSGIRIAWLADGPYGIVVKQ